MSSQSHRGNSGPSSAKKSHRNPLLSKEVRNIKKVHVKSSSQGHNRRSERDSNSNSYSNAKPVNMLRGMEGIRGIGVGKQDATPQELYAIGAVFDHIYRGGSPLNCVSVFQKEVDRAPRRKTPYGCGGFGCGSGSGMREEASIVTKMASADADDDDDDDDDDDTLSSMAWTYNRSSLDDLYTLEDRSFVSRDSTFQSSLDQPWDEEHSRKIGISAPCSKIGIKHKSDGSSVDMTKSESRETSNSEVSSLDRKQDDAMKRVMSWSKVLVAVAKENAPIAMAAASKATYKAAKAAKAAAAGAGATARTETTTSFARSDLTSLVHMFRNTISEGIPDETGAPNDTTLQASLSSLVRNYKSQEEDDFYSTDGSYDASISSPPKPLNSLAKAMRSIANKEPIRSYALSERDQVVRKDATTKSTRLRPMHDVFSSDHRGTESKTSNVTSPQELRRETSSISPISADSSSPLKRYNIADGFTTTSLSSISRSNAEGKGFHRGDAAFVATPPRGKIPSSIQVAPKELFDSPPRITASSSGASIVHRRSLFRRRASTDDTIMDTIPDQSNHNPSSKFSPSRPRHLPPVPPDMSPTTPSASSPSRNLYLSSDNDGTELCIIGYSEEADNVSVITDRSTAAPIPSSSAKSLSGISIKKIFSFRERKTSDNSRKDKACTNANSPRRVNTNIFQSPTADTRTDLFYEESIISESMDNNDIIIVNPINFGENDTSTTDGVLFTVNNQEASEYEVQSV